MASSMTQDIYKMLCQKHPNQNIYVIGDQHFFHSNIINYTRKEFSDVLEMNQHIIKQHNETVGKDAIVIFLGDFCFKNSYIKEALSQMNGHKYLILGNHDSVDLVKHYPSLGFESVFVMPIKMDDIYLSHEPLIEGEKDNLQFNLIVNEFQKSIHKLNYHGHIHDKLSFFSDNYKNVACETIDYRPLLIGKTVEIEEEKLPLFINSKYFDQILTEIETKMHIQVQLLLEDYIYSMMLESLSNYEDEYFIQGSYGLLKKYNLITNLSDLDISFFYNESTSKRRNNDLFKKRVDEIYQHLMSIDKINLSFLKRYSSLRVFEASYTTCHPYFASCFLDSNLIALNCYQQNDFIQKKNISIIQQYLQSNCPSMVDEYHFPTSESQFLIPEGDLANLVLKFIYQQNQTNKSVETLKRLRYICKNILTDGNLYSFPDILGRLLLRNISFLYTTNRFDEIEFIKNRPADISILEKFIPTKVYEQISEEFNNSNSNFSQIINEISNTPNEKILEKSKKFINCQ